MVIRDYGSILLVFDIWLKIICLDQSNGSLDVGTEQIAYMYLYLDNLLIALCIKTGCEGIF